MNDKTRPMVFTLRLDFADAELVRRLCQQRNAASPQRGVLAVLHEFDERMNRVAAGRQEAAVEELTYQRLYFDLAEETLEVRRQVRRLLRALDQAKVYVEGMQSPKKKRRNR